MKKTLLRIFVLVMAVVLAFTVVHFAVLGNNAPTNTAFTFALDGDNAIVTGSTDALSGAVVLPAELGGHTVVGIGENAFKDCADVTAFFLPGTITSIGAYAFENCTGLLQAILPDGLTSIGEGAFWNCSGLVSITVPTSVTSIGSCAFYKCDALESLVVPGIHTPLKGAFNVALDIGQYVAIGNPARHALDPIVTTVYCYEDSAAHLDVMQDGFTTYAFLNDGTSQDAGNLTSYTILYKDETGADVAPSVTLNTQPIGINIAAVATVPEDEELAYPETAVQTIVLADNAADNTITFVYAVQTYTITFDADGGDAKDALVYMASDDAVLGETTRRGYTLTGWKVAEASEEDHYNWGDVDTVYPTTESVNGKFGNVTLKAVWQADSMTVTFDGQNGTPDFTETTVTFGETYGELPDAAREGYTFTGWYTEDGVKIESSTTVTATEAHTLFANWTINKYDVTVTTSGNGTASADLTADVEYGTPVTLTAVPDIGYEFLAWESDDVTIADNAFTMPDKAVAVNATFKATEYTISFDTDGGDAIEPLKYTIADGSLLPSASKAGYTLICWNVAETGGNWGDIGSAYFAGASVTGKFGSVTLKAAWRANAIKVTYDAHGGTCAVESKTVSVGGTYGVLATATREGYTFAGWYTAADGGTKVEPTTTVSQTESHMIYAYWTINKYNVTLATDNNGFVSADATEDVEYGTLVTLTATPKPGFEFAGWTSDDVTVEDNTFTMPDKAVRVRATFSPITYTVTYDANGGEAKDPLAYKTTDETTLGDTVKEGYTLVNWQVSVPAAEGDYNWGDVQKTYTKDQSVRGKYGDVTLKAIWEGNTLTLTYDAQGGTATAASKSVTVGNKYGTLARASREGYTFNGWFTAEGTQIDANTIVTKTGDHTVYAHWTINTHNVTVTTDGHGTASADLTTDVEYGKLVTLTAEPDAGYTFLDWDCAAVTVTDNTFSMPDKTVTIRALFAANDYMIAFDANGGSGDAMNPIDAQYDTDVDLPACTFERAGYEFLGWAQDANAEEPDYTDEASVKNLTSTANETVTLYAIWKDVKVELIAKEGSTTVIDEETGFIYGLAFNLTLDKLQSDYLDIVGNGHLSFNDIDAGTGTVVTLYNDNTGEQVKSYTIVIFGDVNGDGAIGPDDVTKVRTLAARLGDDESAWALTNPNAFAANVFEDEQVNQTDVGIIRALAGRVNGIDQVTRQTYVLN